MLYDSRMLCKQFFDNFSVKTVKEMSSRNWSVSMDYCMIQIRRIHTWLGTERDLQRLASDRPLTAAASPHVLLAHVEACEKTVSEPA